VHVVVHLFELTFSLAFALAGVRLLLHLLRRERRWITVTRSENKLSETTF
jgi:hypothetical protein